MEIIQCRVEDLKPYAGNAKKHPAEQVRRIANSIKEFGFRQPIVIDQDNVIIIGHGRLWAAEQLGMETVPCVRVDDLNEDQINALRLADNKTNESEWDIELLNEELMNIDIDMHQFGFDDIFIENENDEKNIEGAVPFTEELLLTHNYIVLYFDNDFDWNVAQEKFGL